MKFEVLLKITLGLIVISFTHLVTVEMLELTGWLHYTSGFIFWIVVLIFMDWRHWVTYEFSDKITAKTGTVEK